MELITPAKIGDYLNFNTTSLYYELNGLADLKVFLPFSLEDFRFRIKEDINLIQEPGFYVPIFLGKEFDGSGWVISNLNVSLPNINLGFFGYISNDVRIANISVMNVTVSGYEQIGGLVG
ncbi:MAG: hypothetical protein KAW09_00155, partial [Thermoplasmata archaeon]|nr:hypothetical protein [Thermoplasmata archaeon]